MLSEKMQEALNAQINAELYSSYLYLAMAAYLNETGLGGFSRWMEVQALEELSHAMKIYDYVNERGGRVTLAAIEAPPARWDSLLHVFQEVYKHEQKVTGLINDLVDLAVAERDHATNNFLQWFVKEQVEEEASADGILQKVKLVENARGGVFMLDRELGQRAFSLPPGTTLVAPPASA
ncbi:ferritin [Desulfacinum hydrothermale DSM 13146]|uniref:Ferritin n=1 Tax=Desulfacinum hydrothermale DSM 13146 TaxID=1121390 RepID=A0A1W1XA26_9BACT|nr:ferritin [Desulfacinum hydrothermale]SMC20713.1 ferritin [Desulfacinum hydrothermale DSM 13146]